jgi:RND family efflux transporter MFP subunit
MKKWLKWLLPVLVLALIVGAVVRTISARKAEQAAAPKVAAAPLALELAPGDVVTARELELTHTLAVTGGLKAVQSALVKAKVAAELRSLTVREGDAVKKGQVIGQLDATELDLRLRQAEQSASSARAQVDVARRALENNRALVAQGFISSTGLETSISNEAVAQANLQAAVAGVDLARKARADATLVAPLSGLVSQRLAQPGERLSVDARVVEIVDLSRMELEAAVAAEEVPLLKVGAPAQLTLEGMSTRVGAKVARINPSTQAGSRAIMVYLAVDPHPALRQGLFAKGSIELARKTALAVPVSAVRTDQTVPQAVVVDGSTARVRPLQLGLRGEVEGQPWVEVTQGLQVGAQVLSASAGLVRDGTPLRLSSQPPAGKSAPLAKPAKAPDGIANASADARTEAPAAATASAVAR